VRIVVATSIKQLIQIGLFLVALPLSVGLATSIYQVDRLHEATSATLHETTSAIAAGRSLVTLALNMERIAGQFSVLEEKEQLQRYKRQRVPFSGTLNKLAKLSLRDTAQLHLSKLRNSEEELYQYLKNASEVGVQQTELEEPDISLYALANKLQLGINRSVAAKATQLEQRSKSVQNILWLQALVLIPLAMMLLIIFGGLITSPLNQLSQAIRRMSTGNFTEPVTISGPEDTRELGTRLDKLRTQLSNLEQQKLSFLQHVSHELKTPLTSLREGVSLLQDGVLGQLTDTQTEVVDILNTNGQQLQKEVEALLDFNQALLEEKQSTPEEFNLSALLHDCMESQHLQLRAREITIKSDLKVAKVRADKKQISTVMDNLLSNAIKYAPPSSTVQLNMTTTSSTVHVDIIDSGPGVDADDAAHIFEPFYQGAIARRGTVSGTGLGLAIAQRYITQQNGTLALQNSGQGAHFRVTLPLRLKGVH